MAAQVALRRHNAGSGDDCIEKKKVQEIYAKYSFESSADSNLGQYHFENNKINSEWATQIYQNNHSDKKFKKDKTSSRQSKIFFQVLCSLLLSYLNLIIEKVYLRIFRQKVSCL